MHRYPVLQVSVEINLMIINRLRAGLLLPPILDKIKRGAIKPLLYCRLLRNGIHSLIYFFTKQTALPMVLNLLNIAGND